MKSKADVKHRLQNRPQLRMTQPSIKTTQERTEINPNNGSRREYIYGDVRNGVTASDSETIAKHGQSAVIRQGGQAYEHVAYIAAIVCTIVVPSPDKCNKVGQAVKKARKHFLRFVDSLGASATSGLDNGDYLGPTVFSVSRLTESAAQSLREYAWRTKDITLEEHGRALPSNGTSEHAKAFHSPRPKRVLSREVDAPVLTFKPTSQYADDIAHGKPAKPAKQGSAPEWWTSIQRPRPTHQQLVTGV